MRLLPGLLLALAVMPLEARWFETQDTLADAHAKLLQGNVSESFDQMVQLWQKAPTGIVATNLENLLQSAISVDCGHSLTDTPLPAWVTELTLQREKLLHVNQVSHGITVSGVVDASSLTVDLVRWPDHVVASGKTATSTQGHFVVTFRRMNEAIMGGLYQLNLTTSDDVTWSQWVLLTAPPKVQRLNWVGTESWNIESRRLPMRGCTRDELEQKLYPLDSLYQHSVWSETQQSQLPTFLDRARLDVDNGSYWFSLALINTRWQGELKIQEVQRLIKPVNLEDKGAISAVTSGE
uniref:DUF2861 family protein n=1 Tax=Thaumasiovibrio occultus TaxID=1891184 RepID=UPI000B364A57|nr:DUF2861 family protein [Thaumasiovibrio occultus]